VIAVAGVIALSGANAIDPLLSLVLALVVARMVWPITRDATQGMRHWTDSAAPTIPCQHGP